MSGLHLPIESISRVRLRVAGDDRLVELVRRGDRTAFEVIYDRHSTALLSFCVYMLGSHQDAEDALQATFSSAHRSLLADDRSVALRPWLFAIARNACLSILRQRRSWVELNGEPALGADPLHQLEVRDEVRHVVDGLLSLPEPQRAALVLAEMHGLSQSEIATMLGVQPKQVKAYTYQARANLLSDRAARETDCREIREELTTARGAARLKSRLRRHLRACDGCRDYERGLLHHQRQLGALLPVMPSLALKARTLEAALGSAGVGGSHSGVRAVGGGAAGTAALAGGIKSLAATLVAGVACVGACGVGASLLGISVSPAGPTTTGATQVPRVQAGLSAEGETANVSATPRSGGTAGVTAFVETGSSAPAREGGQPPRFTVSPSSPRVESGGSGPTVTVDQPGDAGGEHSESASPPQDDGVREAEHPVSSSQAGTEPAHPTREGAKQKAAAEKRKQRHEESALRHQEERQLAREQRLQGEEEERLGREKQERERKEHEREMRALPPGERKSERERHRVEREERKAKREERKAKNEELKAERERRRAELE